MEIINRVAQSALVTLDLAEYHTQGERVTLDIKGWLFQEMILREKDFRMTIKDHDWSQYSGKHVAVYCSVDAIIPAWAFMLISSRLVPYAETIVQGDLMELENTLFYSKLINMDVEPYKDQKVVIKGCGDLYIPNSAYMLITQKLSPVVASLMYGEPCSTVPVFKRPKK